MICSIRKISVILGAALLAGGCQVAKPLEPSQVNTTPIVLDEAMANRLWPQSKCEVPSFSSTTGPAEVILVPSSSDDAVTAAAIEPGLFLADSLLLPVAMVQTPPWAQIESPAYYLPPSYTVNPPTIVTHAGTYGGGAEGYNYAAGRAVRYDSN
jgi:hypothetical protein